MKLRYLDVLGLQAEDTVTGFNGTIIAVAEWMNGCVRYGIQPNRLDKDGKVIGADWFDSAQVAGEEKQGGVISRIAKAAFPGGGPRDDPVDEW